MTLPIYEYRCSTCGERYESLFSHSNPSPPSCPRCGATRVERLLSTFVVGRPTAAGPAVGPCGSPDCACRSPHVE
ncbi:MAG TPA: zinc ribbon domain-containing protein [Candidatus Eisenbacteria bacterium]